MTTDRVVVQDVAKRFSVDHTARECAWRDAPDGSAYGHSGATEDDQGKARRRSLRWMELGWDGATTAVREEARKEAVLEMLRGLVADSRRGVQARVFVARWEAPW
jgi:hypothetical protein